MAKAGDLFYKIMLDYRDFVTGTKITKAEFREIKRVASEMAGEMGKLGLQFDKFARLARGGGKDAEVMAKSFGQLTVKSAEAKRAGKEFVRQLREEATELRNRKNAGQKLNAAEEQRLKNNQRIAHEFIQASRAERSEKAQQLLAERKLINARRDGRHAREQDAREQRRRGKAFFEQVNSHRAAQQQITENERRQLLIRGRLFQQYVNKQRAGQQQIALEEQKKQNIRGRLFLEYMNNHRRENSALASQADAYGGLQRQVLALAKQIGFITVAYKAWHAAGRAFSMALELERSQIEFEIFTGSAKDAANIIEKLRDLAANTPLTLEGSQQATRTLLQYGVGAREVISVLRQLGDVSGGSHERLQRLSLAMGQITANGRLQGQELRQLVESGFNPLQVISERTGEEMLELRNRMADGAVSAGEVRQALRWATSEGGRFAGMMERVANETASGQLTVAAGQFQKLGASLGMFLTEDIGALAKEAGRSAGWWSEKLDEINKKHARELTDVELLTLSYEKMTKAQKHQADLLKKQETSAFGMPTLRFSDAQRKINAMGISMEDLSEEAKKFLFSTHAEEKAVIDVTEEYEALVREMEKANRVAKDGADAEELRALKLQGYNREQLAHIKKLQEEAKKLEADKDAEVERKREQERMQREKEREAERAKKEGQDAAQEIRDSLRTPIEVLRDELLHMRNLVENSFLSFEEFQAKRLMMIRDFNEEQKQRDKKNEREKPQRTDTKGVSRGSSEEFNMMKKMFSDRIQAANDRKSEEAKTLEKQEQIRTILEFIQDNGIKVTNLETVGLN